MVHKPTRNTADISQMEVYSEYKLAPTREKKTDRTIRKSIYKAKPRSHRCLTKTFTLIHAQATVLCKFMRAFCLQ